MIEGAANPDAVVDKAHLPLTPMREGRDWAVWDGKSALLIACFSADLTIARLLLEAGASTELRVNKIGATVLMFIANNSAQLPARGIPAAELLLDCGAEVNAVDDDGGTPLISAAYGGNTAMVETLPARGASVHMKTTAGEKFSENALVLAVAQGHLDTARALLEAGADADSADNKGFTVAKIAVLKKKTAMLELLLRYGASAATAVDPRALDPLWDVQWTQKYGT
jgi:ankyrin repeat protein